jgi:hypothetical protein
MKKRTREQRDQELKQVMAEERSRGRRQPTHAISLENRRRLNLILKLLADRNCDRRRYMEVIRDDFGHPDGSPEFARYMKIWDERH